MDMLSPCGHSPGGRGAALTGAGMTYMFCLLKSASDADPPAPPPADKVPATDALALAWAAASAVAAEFECESFELLSVFVEVDGAEGVTGGVQVGQLEPPFLQVVASDTELARASAAATIRWVVFKVLPRWWLRWYSLRASPC